jgi:hypothetical protein
MLLAGFIRKRQLLLLQHLKEARRRFVKALDPLVVGAEQFHKFVPVKVQRCKLLEQGVGHSVDEIHALYKKHVVTVMACKTPKEKTASLKALAVEVFKEQTFEDVQTGIGIVTTKWINDRPMVFKGSKEQAHGRQETFKPGFGCTIADAVQASCSAYPFFEKKLVKTPLGDFELIDGGFCANNPTLYALADVTGPLGKPRADIRVVSVGVGAPRNDEYPYPTSPGIGLAGALPGNTVSASTRSPRPR